MPTTGNVTVPADAPALLADSEPDLDVADVLRLPGINEDSF
jgi:hypothetical protein